MKSAGFRTLKETESVQVSEGIISVGATAVPCPWENYLCVIRVWQESLQCPVHIPTCHSCHHSLGGCWGRPKDGGIKVDDRK